MAVNERAVGGESSARCHQMARQAVAAAAGLVGRRPPPANQYNRSLMTSPAIPHAIGLDLTHPIIY